MDVQRPAIVLLAATLLSGCYKQNDVVSPSELLSLVASPVAIPANGFATTQLIAMVDPKVDRALQVTFTTTRGTIVNSQTSPDSSGHVTALLRSDTTPGMVVVTVEVKKGTAVQASRSADVEFTAAAGGSVVQLRTSSSTLPADGASHVQVIAEVNAAVASRLMTFRTTQGSFAPDEVNRSFPVTATADGTASIFLYAPKTVGAALVTVEAGGFSASQVVTFIAALPDFISVRAAPLEVKASETDRVAVTATLSRVPGDVTVNTAVSFSATNDATGESFGSFSNIKRSGQNQEASADFSPGGGAPLGVATITARVSENSLTARIKIRVVAP